MTAPPTSTAVPRSAQGHLWKLPVQKSASSVERSTGSWPGTCAASTSTGTDRSCATRMTASTGSTRAVGEVMWSTTTSLVDSVIAPAIASTT